MNINDVKQFLIDNPYKKHFRVYLNDGTSVLKRLFYNPIYELPCEYAKGSKRYGNFISQREVDDWKYICLINKGDNITKVRKFMTNVIKYLSQSGLWEDIKVSYEKLLQIPYDEFKILLESEYTEQRKLLNEKYQASFYVDSIVYSANKGIKTMNFDRYDKDIIRNNILQNIKEKKGYKHYWRKGYDNSFELRYDENDKKGRAWYSEEFKNCGNGHYYIALDEKHAIYVERD